MPAEVRDRQGLPPDTWMQVSGVPGLALDDDSVRGLPVLECDECGVLVRRVRLHAVREGRGLRPLPRHPARHRIPAQPPSAIGPVDHGWLDRPDLDDPHPELDMLLGFAGRHTRRPEDEQQDKRSRTYAPNVTVHCRDSPWPGTWAGSLRLWTAHLPCTRPDRIQRQGHLAPPVRTERERRWNGAASPEQSPFYQLPAQRRRRYSDDSSRPLSRLR